MAKTKLAPIPTPLNVKWREFRVKALPILVFAGVAASVMVLWKEQTAPGALTGEVEGAVSQVTAPVSGSLAELFVRRFEEVQAGETIGRVMQASPEILQASLAVIRKEIELTRLGWFDPVLDQRRNRLQFEEFRLDLLDRRAELAIRRIELWRAERSETRYTRLYDEGHVSEEDAELARQEAEVLRTTVSEEEAVLAEMERVLENIGEFEDRGIDETIAATLAWHEERLNLTEAELRPVPLVAPISGVVSELLWSNGTTVAAGEPILTIRSTVPEHIVAYVREPLAFQPEIGGEMEIRARNASRSRGSGTVLAVGAQVEPLLPTGENPFVRPVAVEPYQAGLPILISLPENFELRPGELVDVDPVGR